MEFIKRMKKREFVEMALKTAIALFIAFIAIILMEGMIYAIEVNAYRKSAENGSTMVYSESAVIYCLEEDDGYFILCNDTTQSQAWSCSYYRVPLNSTKEAVLRNIESTYSRTQGIKHKAPSAFDFSITGVHYIVMAVFVAAVAGYFVYRFVALSKEYNKIETKFKKTGEIELG